MLRNFEPWKPKKAKKLSVIENNVPLHIFTFLFVSSESNRVPHPCTFLLEFVYDSLPFGENSEEGTDTD